MNVNRRTDHELMEELKTLRYFSDIVILHSSVAINDYNKIAKELNRRGYEWRTSLVFVKREVN